jgi:hypothetical protein
MLKDKKLLKSRVAFNQAAITDPKKAAQRLRDLADSLEQTRNFSDTLYALSQICYVSERTIIRDLRNDTL